MGQEGLNTGARAAARRCAHRVAGCAAAGAGPGRESM